MHSLISSDNTLLIWAVLIIYVFLAMYAERHWKWAQAVGAALICLVGGMLLSSLGLMPSTSGAYDVIWSMVTPLAIPLVLFAADLKKIIKESGKMLIMFLITCCGTMLGAILAAVIFHGKIAEVWKPAAMFTGSQTGGSVNVVVMADVWDITGSTFDAIYVADIITFTFTLFTLVMLPSVAILRKKYKCMYNSPIVHTTTEENGSSETALTVFSIAKALATSFAIVSVSVAIADFVNAHTDNFIVCQLLGQKYLLLTLITVILATAFPKFFDSMKGAQDLGIFMMFIFFVAVSIEADLKQIVSLGPWLILFSVIVFVGILFISLLFGKIFKFSIEEISVAANAALGGPTTAAASAAARGYSELVTPAVLVGTLGYVLGNFFGVFVGNVVLAMFG